VNHEGEHVIRRRQPDEGHPNRYRCRDVEASEHHLGDCSAHIGLGFGRLGCQIERHFFGRENSLLRAVRVGRVDRAQRFVSGDDIGHSRLQRRDIEFTGQPHRQRDVVGARLRVEVVEHPHALLGERERDPVGTRLGDQRRSTTGTGKCGNSVRESLDCGRVEQSTHRHRRVQGGTDA